MKKIKKYIILSLFFVLMAGTLYAEGLLQYDPDHPEYNTNYPDQTRLYYLRLLAIEEQRLEQERREREEHEAFEAYVLERAGLTIAEIQYKIGKTREDTETLLKDIIASGYDSWMFWKTTDPNDPKPEVWYPDNNIENGPCKDYESWVLRERYRRDAREAAIWKPHR